MILWLLLLHVPHRMCRLWTLHSFHLWYFPWFSLSICRRVVHWNWGDNDHIDIHDQYRNQQLGWWSYKQRKACLIFIGMKQSDVVLIQILWSPAKLQKALRSVDSNRISRDLPRPTKPPGWWCGTLKDNPYLSISLSHWVYLKDSQNSSCYYIIYATDSLGKCWQDFIKYLWAKQAEHACDSWIQPSRRVAGDAIEPFVSVCSFQRALIAGFQSVQIWW